MAAAALLIAAASAVSNTTGSRVLFDASHPWIFESGTHNAFSPQYPTEAEARAHGTWLLSGVCTLTYNGTLKEPPRMVLLANGANGLDPQRAQEIPLVSGTATLPVTPLRRLDVVCHDSINKKQCFWFGQLTLAVSPSAGIPDGGARSSLDCQDVRVCEPAGGACFACIQGRRGCDANSTQVTP
eukprot:TRINITY_DN10249_c0_g1_i1.p1 TRINITY_DN10249_c0_g1~~TRINITY_DN10249_c0_g1_i1.p1  ORF type:complete len:204 (+),score=39.83 TRINITY_DN10249_c0_g1_i1:62-613(+)